MKFSDIAEKAKQILNDEYDHLINEGVDPGKAIKFNGKDPFALEAFSSWKPSEVRQAKIELARCGFIEEDIVGNIRLANN